MAKNEKELSDREIAELREIRPEMVERVLQSYGYKVKEVKGISSEVETSKEVKKIIIPYGMDKRKASEELYHQWENEEQEIDVSADFEGWNWKDVLVALKKTSEEVFGWIKGKSTWWSGNPTEIDIIVDLKNGKAITEKAFYGMFTIPAYDDALCNIQVIKGVVYISTTCKKKYSQDLTDFYNTIRNHLSAKSIYKGKAIVVTENKAFPGTLDFEIIENFCSDKIILNEDEKILLDHFVLSNLGEGGKRCVLFSGAFGNGKTETAMLVGKKANEKNMSFFYLKKAALFDIALAQVKKYSPALLFLEDIDEIASGENRDDAMNAILNTLDGVQTKGNNLTVILTTNNENRINTALRRPGRIDLVIKFKNPNVETRAKIFKTYFEDMKGEKEVDYVAISEKTGDVSGAVVAEICKRVNNRYRQTGVISTDLVKACILSMEEQINLMRTEPEAKNSVELALSTISRYMEEARLN